MSRTARNPRLSPSVDITHEGAKFHEAITVQAESGPVALTWIQCREITRWVESIAEASRACENFRMHRLIRRSKEQLAELKLTLPEGRAIRTYYLDEFYDPKIPMRCHW